MRTKKANPYGLEANVPERGATVDCYSVACTAVLLESKRDRGNGYQAARHAVTLHRISGLLHRLAERECNEDLNCPKCDGTGERIPGADAALGMGGKLNAEQRRHGIVCRACAGDGRTLGRQKARLRAGADDIAAHYGLRCYFQTDCRGCSLYLIDPADIPAASELAKRDVSHACSPNAAEYLRSPEAWIESNYNRGHAVGRIGR